MGLRPRVSLYLALVFVAACRDEAILHPPMPPAVTLPDLYATQPSPAAADTHVADVRSEKEPENRVAAPPTPTEPAPAKPGPDTVGDTPLPHPNTATLSKIMKELIAPRARIAMAKHRPDPQLEALLSQLKLMVPDDPKFVTASPSKSWAGIVDNALKSGRYVNSCKQCHKLWEKPYHKKYHTLPVEYYLP